MTERVPESPDGFAPGSRVAGYLLQDQIGQGGMAVVFRAHDERLDRTVALKILAPSLAEDEVFRQRFIRESRAAAAVDDPCIIPVFEAGEASGVLFIATRFVAGGDVRSLVARSGPMAPNRAAEIISQVASALDAAHARDLVHRDVKPANILLDGSSGAGRPDHVYLCDFGLSKGSLQASGLTGTGIFLGTLDYIAPEQINGQLVDGRADQYALACTAFEMLTGSPPFPRQEAVAVMYAQLSEPPPALSSWRAGLPASVDSVFARALAKVPADRYRSCREFAEAMRSAFGLRPFDSGPGEVPSGPHPSAGGQARNSGLPTAYPAYPGAGPGFPPGNDGQYDPGYAAPGGRSSRRRTTLAIVAAAAVVVVGGAAGFALATGNRGGGDNIVVGHNKHQQQRQHQKPQHQRQVGHAPVALKPPDCVRTAATGRKLADVPVTQVPGSTGLPFGIAVSSDGKAVFVVTDGAVQVYKASNGGLAFTGQSYPVGSSARKATTATVTPDGRYLLVATDNGVMVLDAAAAENGDQSAILGSLQVPGLTKYGRAVGVAVTPDDKFAFVSLQFRDEVGVFNLGKALREQFAGSGSGSAYYVGSLNVGAQPVGLTMSPDGTTLYATAFLGNSAVPGTLSVVDVVRATNSGQIAHAVVAKITTGCFPARVAVSGDGGTVWVTARESNFVLGYSASALRQNPGHALIAAVHVGIQPIGIALVSGGKRIVVTDDNNVSTPPPDGNLAIIDTAAALDGKPALLGYIPAGQTPHEMVLSPDGRILYVTNYDGSKVQIVSTGQLP